MPGAWQIGCVDARGAREHVGSAARWTIGEANDIAPQQLSALKIKITANAVAGEDPQACNLS